MRPGNKSKGAGHEPRLHRYRIIATITVLALPTIAMAQKTERVPWTLSVKLVNVQPRLGMPIAIEVALRNESSGMLRAVDSYAFADYDFILKDARGSVVPFNKETQKQVDAARSGVVFHSTWHEVASGAAYKQSFDINKMYDLKPGTYSLVVTRLGTVEPDSTRFVKPVDLVSPRLVFEVQPASQP